MSTTTEPDGYTDWKARRHGVGHPNQPRELTQFTVRVRDGKDLLIEGNNGTTLVQSVESANLDVDLILAIQTIHDRLK